MDKGFPNTKKEFLHLASYGQHNLDLALAKPRVVRVRLFNLLQKNRYSRKFLHNRFSGQYLARLFMNRETVYIYSARKTGTESLKLSLRMYYAGHVYKDHEKVSERIVKPIKIISMVRNPIDGNVGDFFQRFYRGLIPNIHYNPDMSTADMKRMFLENFDEHDHPLSWFEENLEQDTGIDVYKSQFPSEGYRVYDSPGVSLLVIKLETADKTKTSVIKEFLRLRKFEMININMGKQKIYYEHYKKFKNEVKLPPDYVERMCSSRYFRHFYSPSEIEQVRRRWSE